MNIQEDFDDSSDDRTLTSIEFAVGNCEYPLSIIESHQQALASIRTKVNDSENEIPHVDLTKLE